MDHADAKAIPSTWPERKEIKVCGTLTQRFNVTSEIRPGYTSDAGTSNVYSGESANWLTPLVVVNDRDDPLDAQSCGSILGAQTPSLCSILNQGGIPTVNVPVLSLTETITTTRQVAAPASSSLSGPMKTSQAPTPLTLPATTTNPSPWSQTFPASDNTQAQTLEAGANSIQAQQTDTPDTSRSTGESAYSYYPDCTFVNAWKVLKHVQALETRKNKEITVKGSTASRATAKETVTDRLTALGILVLKVVIKRVITTETKAKTKEGTSKPRVAKETVK